MRMTLRTTTVAALASALVIASITPATARPGPGPVSWSADLAAGDPAGITLDAGAVRLDPHTSHLAPADTDTDTDRDTTPVPTGLLTLPAHLLDTPTDRVDSAVTGDLPPGSTATVDVRGRRPTGAWTEWIPAGMSASAVLPEPTTEVQGRLVLTATPGTRPAVHALTLTAHPASAGSEGGAATATPPRTFRVFATREGLVGGITANGHRIAERDHFVALPSRRALAPRGTSDYAVKVCAPNGRCAFAPVWDVGPWNTRDDYWNPADQRQEWTDLPHGVPQAQAAFGEDYNGGRDQFDREVRNPAGIDLGDGLFWDALGLTDNSFVTVDYLWTGQSPLAPVTTDRPLDVLAAPDPAAAIVGIVADRAALPVECVVDSGVQSWLRIGADQYVDAAAVPDHGVTACEPADAARQGVEATGGAATRARSGAGG